jgi:hypothetical protein
MLIMAYTFYIPAYWFFERYFYPICVVTLLVVATYADQVFQRIEEKSSHPTAIVLIAVIIVLNVQQRYFLELLFSDGRYDRGYMRIGLWASREFKPNTVIGAMQSGGIGYFGENLRVVNLDGVVNKAAHESITKGKMMDYIRSQNVEFIIGWKADSEFIALRSSKSNDLIFLRQIEEVRASSHPWLLWKTGEK